MDFTDDQEELELPSPTVDVPSSQPLIADKLEQIKRAARQGQHEQAYELSCELTHLAPDNVEGWLYRAVFARNQEQGFVYLSRALSLAPEHTRARRGLYEMLKYYMERDPFLRYLEESGPLYRVLTGESGAIIVPKDRETSIPYLWDKPTLLQPVYRWLGYSLLGLPLAGIPTLVCATIAWGFACRAVYRSLGTTYFRRAEVALIYATVLWMIGFLFSFLFVLHL